MSLSLIISFFSVVPVQAATLQPDQYISQVLDQNPKARSLKLQTESARLLVNEASLLTAPYFFIDAQRLTDERPTNNPQFMGTKTMYNNYSFGLEEQTPIGLNAKLSYQINETEIFNVSPAFVPQAHFFDAKPNLELSFSLWKNLFGKEVRLTQQALSASKHAQEKANAFQLKLLLAQAEQSYWALALAKQNARLLQETFDRAQKLRDWSSKRVRLQLADRADLLQAEANMELRKLEHQSALDDERETAQQFNSLRGKIGDVVPEEILGVEEIRWSEEMKKLSFNNAQPMREDLEAAQFEEEATAANAQLGLQRHSPDFELYSSFGYNGRDQNLNEAVQESFSSDHPTWLIGIRFKAPLHLSAVSKSRDGYRLQEEAGKKNYERKSLDLNHDWTELRKQFQETKQRFELAQKIEKIQKNKLEHERFRHSKGRTTTYQLLMFEQDLATAQLNRIRIQTQLLGLWTQLKTFTLRNDS